jgi:Xaa-Pro aminopeptidase
MKTDLDQLMQDAGVQALLVMGSAQHNPPMVYLTGGGHLTYADLIRKTGHPGILFHADMERDEAGKCGLETQSYSHYPYAQLLQEAEGNVLKAMVLRYKHMFEDVGLTSGKVLLYGKVDAGRVYALICGLQAIMPHIEFEGFQQEDVLLTAMATKDSSEIDRIKKMGKLTTRVVGNVADFLSERPVRNGMLLGLEGDPLTIGEVKNRINLWLAEVGAENPEGTIFAIGKDAGVPHSSGSANDILRLGEPIVFDIFPCEALGGYYFDMTRTWCLGYAPDDVQLLYEQVKTVYYAMVSELKLDEPFGKYQKRTCELFESMGHPTILTKTDTQVGYTHSLGHGVGLNIHERPFSGLSSTAKDSLKAGSVFTIEPGLYYPDRGMGMRLENTHFAGADGLFEVLADYPLDLVIPVQG